MIKIVDYIKELKNLYYEMQAVEIKTRKFEIQHLQAKPYEIGDYLASEISDHRHELMNIIMKMEYSLMGCNREDYHCHDDNKCVDIHKDVHCDDCHGDCRCFDLE